MIYFYKHYSHTILIYWSNNIHQQNNRQLNIMWCRYIHIYVSYQSAWAFSFFLSICKQHNNLKSKKINTRNKSDLSCELATLAIFTHISQFILWKHYQFSIYIYIFVCLSIYWSHTVYVYEYSRKICILSSMCWFFYFVSSFMCIFLLLSVFYFFWLWCYFDKTKCENFKCLF